MITTSSAYLLRRLNEVPWRPQHLNGRVDVPLVSNGELVMTMYLTGSISVLSKVLNVVSLSSSASTFDRQTRQTSQTPQTSAYDRSDFCSEGIDR